MSDGVPSDDIEACARSHARLMSTIEALSETDARAPSRLPGWTRAHVLTHLARNADSVARRLSAAAEGGLVDQYEGGEAGREEEIERGSHRSASELIDDVRSSAQRVDEIFASFPADAWQRPIRAVGRADRPAFRAVYSRWTEVETHHVDLDLGYTIENWPEALVERWLPNALTGAAARADHRVLLAWLIGRGEPPELTPWG